MSQQPGLVPARTAADLERLDPYDLELIQKALAQDPNLPPVYAEDLTYSRLKILMDVLGVAPVWGRAGALIWRLSLDGHLLIFSVTPDALPDGLLTPEVMDRQWTECQDLPDLLVQMNDYARGCRELDGHPPVLHPEDHPEEGAIGFFAPAINRVWLLSTTQVQADLKADNCGGFAQVNHLMQSNMGRLELAQRIAGGLLITVEEFQQHWASFQPPTTPQKRPSEVFIDMASADLAARFKARYLKTKGVS